jgi:hypothetical protein
LNAEEKDVDKFIRSEETKVKDSKLIKAQEQLVNGKNFVYDYLVEGIKGRQDWKIEVHQDLHGNKEIMG